MSLHPLDVARTVRRRLSLENLEARRLLAIDVQQVAEINATDPWQTLQVVKEVNGQSYFVASEPGSPRLDLWITDGTQAGTTRLADLGDISAHQFLQQPLANVNGTLFFAGYDNAHGRELWKSDGTAGGTVLVKDFRSGPGHSVLSSFVNRSGQLLFAVDGELARSNGTTAGTARIKDLRPGSRNDEVRDLEVVGDTVFFTARHDDSGVDLFKTNGTAAGTVMVVDGGDETISNPTNVAGQLYFVKNQHDLWKLDGATPALVRDFSNQGVYPTELTDVDGTLYFVSNASIWKSDGTSAGTLEVAPAGEVAYGLFNMQGRLYFTGGARANLGPGYELWTSNGSQAGTFMVKDLSPGFFEGYGDSSYPSHLTDINGKLHFLAAGSLWSTEGTAESTIQVERGPSSLINQQGTLLFSRQGTSFNTTSLWKSNGTPDAAVEIKRNGPGAGNADPSGAVNVNGTLYFAANDGAIGSELWKVVGNTASLVKDIGPGAAGSVIANLANLGGKLYFTANDSVHGQELWTSDGTADGTVRLSEIAGPFGNAQPRELTLVGNQIFFSAFDNEGWELWKSDGTAGGTVRVKDIHPGSTYEYGSPLLPNSSFPGNLVNFQGTLYFAATTAESGRELWKSDGTAEGTVLVQDIFPGTSQYYPYEVYSGNIANLTTFKGSLFFSATDPVNGRGLWKSDGTAAGTVAVKGATQGLSQPEQLTVVNGSLFLVGTGSDGAELWKSDGTPAGTQQLKDVRAGGLSSNIQQMTNVAGRLFFVADGASGRELWQSDGTSAGTMLVKDIRTGLDAASYPHSSNPTELTNLNGVLFFSADDGNGGRELWKSSGALGATSRVGDIAPCAASSSPNDLVARGNDLFFAAATAGGRELWRARSQRPVVTIPAKTFTYTEDGPAQRLASTAKVADADTPILVGGRLTIAITNAKLGDRLALLPVASISTAGQLVLYKGVVIGTFAGGIDRLALAIELNQNATVEAVQSLVRSVAFRSASENPATDPRTIRFYLADGDGAVAAGQTVQVNVVRHNDAPVLGLGGSIGYVHDQAPITLAPFAGVSDVDSSNFELGRLRVQIDIGAAASNRLAIGSGFTVDAQGNVLLAGTIIGRRTSSGFGTSELIVVFNVNATPFVVQQLVRAITFKTVGGTAGQRRIVFTVSDGNGGVSTPASKLVNVT